MKKATTSGSEDSSLRDLKVLEAIEDDPHISQRDLSKRLGVALGITNALIKTLARKGLVKIRGRNNRSLTYHLTHAGVLHKSKLAMRWTLNTISDYRRLRGEVSDKLVGLAGRGIRRAGIYGANELAEIVILTAPEAKIEIIGIADGADEGGVLANYQVVSLEELALLKPEAIINCTENDVKSIKPAAGKEAPLVYDLIW